MTRLATGAERDDAEAIGRAGRRTDRRRAPRPRRRRPCAGRPSRSASTAEWSSRSHAVSWRSGTSSRTCGIEAAGRGVPVDAADVVARLRTGGCRSSSRPEPEAADRGGRRSSGRRRGGSASARAGGRGRRRWGRDPVGPRRPRPPSRARSAGVGGAARSRGAAPPPSRGAAPGRASATRAMTVSAVTPSASAA